MNGIISESASRNSGSQPKIITSIILGACLLSGFVSGMNLAPTSLSHLNPFRTETIRFGKIAWISQPKARDFKIALSEEEMNAQVVSAASADLAFVPYQFKAEKVRRYSFPFSKHSHVNFLKLERAVAAVKEATRYDAFEDFRQASTSMTTEFSLAMNEPASVVVPTMVAENSISPQTKPSTYEVVDTSPAERLSSESEKHSPHTSETFPGVVLDSEPKVVAPPVALNVKHSLNRQEIDETPSTIVTTQSSALLSNQDAQVNMSSELSKEDQKKLTETLLAVQMAPKKKVTLAFNQNPPRERILSQNKLSEEDSIPDADPTTDETEIQTPHSTVESKTGTVGCAILNNHLFIRPNGPLNPEVNTQLCPSKVTWISKTRAGRGWVKVESDNSLPTLTLHPAPNAGPTLLLDQNGLALISMKSGVHVTKGMGVILGLVPDGYKVDFNGRAEETEYFESSGKNYFAILNAEPGAGVIEVSSKTNPNLTSMVFTPVLDDTISYLDLATPEARTLTIKVVKSGAVNDPEVAKLTVGLSTQSGIQAITRADGQASLKNVNLVPGFPVFVDVSSHTEDASSYTYRYELKQPRQSGTYIVNEISEKSIHHWLSQVKQGLSDQSAMVVGIYDRKKLDGFKHPHYTEVEALTSKFGLEPINYTILWNGKLSTSDPLEGDVPRFMSVQIPEGLSQVRLLNEAKEVVSSELLPISPRVIHVISD